MEEKQYLCSEFGKVVIIYQQQAKKSSTFAPLQKIIKNLIVEMVKNLANIHIINHINILNYERKPNLFAVYGTAR